MPLDSVRSAADVLIVIDNIIDTTNAIANMRLALFFIFYTSH